MAVARTASAFARRPSVQRPEAAQLSPRNPRAFKRFVVPSRYFCTWAGSPNRQPNAVASIRSRILKHRTI
jgi:hypothetical protein